MTPASSTRRSRPTSLLLLLALAAGALAPAVPSWAKHGADDPPGDDRGGDDRGGDDRGGDDRGGSGGNAPRSRNGVFKFDQRSFQAIEGSGAARIVVERSKGERGAVSVNYRVEAGSASSPGDFRPVSGTFTWAAGDGSNRSFVVPLVDDRTSEGNENVRLVLSNPTGGAILDVARSRSTLLILDDDGRSACGSGLCLSTGRFSVEIEAPSPSWARTGSANAGTFERADGSPELLVRVDDECASTGFFAITVGEVTRAPYRLTVVDTWSGVSKQYGRAPGAFVVGRDAATFRCN